MPFGIHFARRNVSSGFYRVPNPPQAAPAVPPGDDEEGPHGARNWFGKTTRTAKKQLDELLNNPALIAKGFGIARWQNRTPMSFHEWTPARERGRLAAAPLPRTMTDDTANPHRRNWDNPEVRIAFEAPVNPRIDLQPNLQAKVDALIGNDVASLARQMDFKYIVDPGASAQLPGRFIAIETAVRTRRRAIRNTPQAAGAAAPTAATVPSTELMHLLKDSIDAACKTLVGRQRPKRTDAQVCEALAWLQDLSLEQTIAGASALRPARRRPRRPGAADAEDLAWRIAHKLAATDEGFQLLKLMTAAADPAPAQPDAAAHARRGIRKDNHLRAFLQGANNLLGEQPSGSRLGADPAAVLRHCCDNAEQPAQRAANTLLIRALPAIHGNLIEEKNAEDPTNVRRTVWQERSACTMEAANALNLRILGQLSRAARYEPGQMPRPYLLNLQAQATDHHQTMQRQASCANAQWTVSALRDGFTSNAPGSDFDLANQRVAKIATYFKRADRGDAEHPRQPEADHSRIPRPFKLNTRKSMLRRDVDFGIATDGAIQDREKMSSALAALETALLQFGGPGGQPLHPAQYDFRTDRRNQQQVLKNLARLALLRSWKATPATELLDGKKQLRMRLPDVTSQADWARLFGAPAATRLARYPRCQTSFNQFLADASDAPGSSGMNDNLTPELLENWASDLNFEQRAARLPAAENGYTGFARALADIKKTTEHLAATEQGLDDMEGDTETARKINHLKTQVAQIRLGGGVSFADGAIAGAGLAGLTTSFTRALSAGAVSGRANVSFNIGKVATLGLAIGTPGAVLEVGVRKSGRIRAGAGVFVGWKVASGKAALIGTGVLVDGTPGMDMTEFTGVRLRLDRLGADVTGREGQVAGVAGDAAIARVLGKIIGITAHDPAQVAQLDPDCAKFNDADAPILEKLYARVPQVSVALVKPGDSKSKDFNATGRAGVLVAALFGGTNYGIGALASGSMIGSHRRQKTVETTGTTRNRTFTVTNRVTGSAQTSIASLFQYANMGTFIEGAANNDKTKGKGGVPQVDAGLISADVYKSGTAHQFQTIYHNGAVNERSYKLVTHLNAEPFAKKIEADMANWVRRLVSYNPAFKAALALPDGADKAAKMDQLLKNQTHIIEDYLHGVRSNAHPNASHVEYLEIDPVAAAKVNRYLALDASARKGERWAAATTYRAAADALLVHNDSYQPRFLVTSDSQASNHGLRVSFGVSYSKDRPFTANRILTYV